VVFLFVAAVSLHSARLYITLEMLEERRKPFEDFFGNQQGIAKDLEFVMRVAMVLIVTNKAIGRWNTISDIFWYLLALYGSLTIWSGIAIVGLKLPWKQSYGGISIFGFLGAAFLLLIHTTLPERNVNLLTGATLFVQIFI